MKEQTWHSADEMKTTLIDAKGEVISWHSLCWNRFTVQRLYYNQSLSV